ncbi:MAG: PsbP-like protein [Bacteroidota bacterium]|jgi:hypothetical protein
MPFMLFSKHSYYSFLFSLKVAIAQLPSFGGVGGGLLLFLFTNSLSAQTAWRQYRTDDKALTIKMPKDWSAEENFENYPLFLQSPYKDKDDHFAENICFYLQKIAQNPAKKVLEDYMTETRKQFPKILTDLKMSEVRYFDLKGKTACEMVCTHQQGNDVLKWKQVNVLKDDTMISITFTALVKTYEEYSATADKIIESVVSDPVSASGQTLKKDKM